MVYNSFKDKCRKTTQSLKYKKIDEAKNDILEEIKHNELMGEKHEKVCRTLNYIDYFLAFDSATSSCNQYLHLPC